MKRIGQVLATIDELGIRENTLIIYMSDNGHSTESANNWGVEYGAHGGGGYAGEWAGHKGTFYEGGIRVPAIVSMPGTVPRGETRNQTITNMDYFQTITELLGLPLPGSELDGGGPTTHDNHCQQAPPLGFRHRRTRCALEAFDQAVTDAARVR